MSQIIKERISLSRCPGPRRPPPDDDPSTAKEALEIFSQRILDLAAHYGDQATADAVRQVVYNWDEAFESLVDLLSPENIEPLEAALREEASLDEQAFSALARGAAAAGPMALKLGKTAIGKAKKLFKKAPKKTAAAGVASTAAGMAGGSLLGTAGGAALGTAAGSMVDQDVNIADISTSDKLGITIDKGSAPWLEELIGQTNNLIRQMIALLGQTQPALNRGISDVDKSIDDMIGQQTGETGPAVHARQQTVAKPSDRSKSVEKTPKKPAPKGSKEKK